MIEWFDDVRVVMRFKSGGNWLSAKTSSALPQSSTRSRINLTRLRPSLAELDLLVDDQLDRLRKPP
jgi:hypothetical protein